jgi:hypothetical protein
VTECEGWGGVGWGGAGWGLVYAIFVPRITYALVRWHWALGTVACWIRRVWERLNCRRTLYIIGMPTQVTRTAEGQIRSLCGENRQAAAGYDALYLLLLCSKLLWERQVGQAAKRAAKQVRIVVACQH